MVVGGAPYVVVQSVTTEVAFIVVDQYRGQRMGHRSGMVSIARDGWLKKNWLADNISMLKVAAGVARFSPGI